MLITGRQGRRQECKMVLPVGFRWNDISTFSAQDVSIFYDAMMQLYIYIYNYIIIYHMYLSIYIYIYVYRSPNFVWCKPTLPFRPVQAILPFQGRRATSMAKGPSSQRHGWIAWSVCGILSADWYNPIMVTMDCMGCVFSDDIVYYNPIMVSLCFF
jgi:hypothetical protein